MSHPQRPGLIAPAERSPTQPAWAIGLMLVAGAVYVVAFLSAVMGSDTEVLQGLTVAPVLFALSIPIATRIGRRDGDSTLSTIILAAAATKLVMAYVQFKLAYGYYAGQVDAEQYSAGAKLLAPNFRRFDFTMNMGPLVGTGYTRVITGLVYAITGTSTLAGFLVFSWFGFVGLVLIARAFKVGIPTGDPRRYLIAVLFLPSLLYWPSTIGKEAIMILAIGLCAFGVANVFQRQATGVLPAAAGLFLVLMIRPHVALLLFAGVAFAVLVRRSPATSYAAPLLRLVGVVLLVALAFFIMSRTSDYLDRSLKVSSLSEQLNATSSRTSEAGSSFTPATVNTPLDIPWATVTVLFRPFPQEAGNIPGLLTSAEGLLLLTLLVASRERVRSVTRMLRTTPYLAFCLGYLFVFVIAFSRFANFGILARQRVQVYPFLLVLIALPRFRDLVAESEESDADDEPRRRTSRRSSSPAPLPRPGTEGTRRRLRPQRSTVSSGGGLAPPPRAGD